MIIIILVMRRSKSEDLNLLSKSEDLNCLRFATLGESCPFDDMWHKQRKRKQ